MCVCVRARARTCVHGQLLHAFARFYVMLLIEANSEINEALQDYNFCSVINCVHAWPLNCTINPALDQISSSWHEWPHASSL